MFVTLPPVRRPEVKPMSEGEAALQEEISKVRERTRLQALAQGVPPLEAEARAATAVEEFCAKWGLKPEAAAPAPPRPAPAPPVRAPAPPAPQRSVDLGSSPLRSPTASGDRTQSIRISEILKKGREGATSSSSNPAIPVPPSLAAPPAAPGAKPSLASVLRRLRSGGLQGESAPPATVTIPIASAAAAAPRSPVLSAPASPPPASPPPAAAPVRTPGITIRHIPVHQQVPPAPGSEALMAAAASLADRRTQILDEFDRTYAEVQTMIEERIAESQGEGEGGSPAPGEGGAAASRAPYTPEEIQIIARDLERLRGGLRSMLLLCEELMSHLGTLVPPQGGEPPAGGGK